MMKVVFAVAVTMLTGAAVAQQTPNAPPAGESTMGQPVPADPAAPGTMGPSPSPSGTGAPGSTMSPSGSPEAPSPGATGAEQPGAMGAMGQPGAADTMNQPAAGNMSQPGAMGTGTAAAAPGNVPMCSRTVRDSCQQTAAMERRAISAAQAERRMGRRGARPSQ